MEWLKKFDALYFVVGRSLLGIYFIVPGLGKIFDFKTKYIDKELTLTEMMLESSTPRNIIAKKWLTKNYGNLEKFESNRNPNYIFYMKDGMAIFDYNRKNGRCYINQDEVWSFLQSVFRLEDEEIKEITKEWVEEDYKLKVTTTIRGNERCKYGGGRLEIEGNNN